MKVVLRRSAWPRLACIRFAIVSQVSPPGPVAPESYRAITTFISLIGRPIFLLITLRIALTSLG
eukprot:6991061-Pyramimonas_sp.AAC.1